MLTDEFLSQVFSPDAPLPTSRLLTLSELSEPEVELLRGRWPTEPADLRLGVIDRLAAITEDNTEVNFDAVFRVGLSDELPEIRVKAIDALWECNQRWLLNELVTLCEEDLDTAVRAVAASHLEKYVLLGVQEELRPSLVEQVESALRRLYGNPREDPLVRRRALEALSPSDDDDINDMIRESYHGIDPDMKLGALYAMGQHCDVQWLPVLLTELKNPNPAARYEAARACGVLEDERAVPALVELTKAAADPEVQEAAITSLGQIGGATAKRVLEDCINQGTNQVKDAARAALDELRFGEDPTGGLR